MPPASTVNERIVDGDVSLRPGAIVSTARSTAHEQRPAAVPQANDHVALAGLGADRTAADGQLPASGQVEGAGAGVGRVKEGLPVGGQGGMAEVGVLVGHDLADVRQAVAGRGPQGVATQRLALPPLLCPGEQGALAIGVDAERGGDRLGLLEGGHDQRRLDPIGPDPGLAVELEVTWSGRSEGAGRHQQEGHGQGAHLADHNGQRCMRIPLSRRVPACRGDGGVVSGGGRVDADRLRGDIAGRKLWTTFVEPAWR